MKPTEITAKGSTKKIYSKIDDIFCSFRTFGGTEVEKNGVITVEDTATVETWYRPDLTADCKIVDDSGKAYEILGTPENIDMKNQFLKFKVRAVLGGA